MFECTVYRTAYCDLCSNCILHSLASDIKLSVLSLSDGAKAIGGRGVSVAINSDRVADLRPLQHIKMVQVEVEPETTRQDSLDAEDAPRDEGEGEGEEHPSPGEGANEPQSPPQTPQTPQSPQTPQAEPQVSQMPVVASAQSPVQPPPDTKGEVGVAGLGRLSPPSLPTVSEGLQEAGSRKAAVTGKKGKKAKPLSTRDLLPLHKDVGRNNKQLLEPSTPEFKPTAEWVRCSCGSTLRPS